MPSTPIQIRAEDKTKAAFRQINSRTEKLNRSFQGLSTSLGGLKTAFVGMVGVGALGKFTKDILTLGDRLQKVSLQTGLAVEDLEILQFAKVPALAPHHLSCTYSGFNSAGFQGQATDIQIHAKEILSLKERLNTIYSKHTGKSVDEIAKALERDNFMTADDAKKFGLIDSVVEKRK